MGPATLAVTETEALETENARLRAVLETIRDMAGVMSVATMNGRAESAAVGLSYLGRLALDALEGR